MTLNLEKSTYQNAEGFSLEISSVALLRPPHGHNDGEKEKVRSAPAGGEPTSREGQELGASRLPAGWLGKSSSGTRTSLGGQPELESILHDFRWPAWAVRGAKIIYETKRILYSARRFIGMCTYYPLLLHTIPETCTDFHLRPGPRRSPAALSGTIT